MQTFVWVRLSLGRDFKRFKVIYSDLQIKELKQNRMSYFSTKLTYVVGTRKNRLKGDGSFDHPHHELGRIDININAVLGSKYLPVWPCAYLNSCLKQTFTGTFMIQRYCT